MVDNFTPQDPTPSAETPIPDEGQKQGFLSTTGGKAVAIIGAVVAFLVIAGIVAFVVFTFFIAGAVNDAADQLANETNSSSTTSGSGSAETSSAIAPTEPGEVSLNSIFTFRDIFDPLIKPVTEETSSTADGTTGDGTTGDGTSLAANTLYLQDVVVENGVSKAVLLYNNATYTLGAGESIPDTPWQVLSVYSGSVTMLYGDSQVTLVVGQGVASK